MNFSKMISVNHEVGKDLSSRARAAELRREILAAAHSENNRVCLDFSGVRTISDSFADELFAVMVVIKGDQWFKEHIAVENLATPLRETVLHAIEHRLAQPSGGV